jgi:hypothetical protein
MEIFLIFKQVVHLETTVVGGVTLSLMKIWLKKAKLSLYQAVEAHRFVRRRGSNIFLDNRLTDGGEVSLTRRPLFTPRKISGTHFC